MTAEWIDNWLRTGALPDGRRPYEVYIGEDGAYACFAPEVLSRKEMGLNTPWPGDPPADDGFQPDWIRI